MKHPVLKNPALSLIVALACIPALTHAGDTPTVLVQTRAVVEKPLTHTLPAFGVLDPDPDQVMGLSLPRAGLIDRMWVRLGQRVKAGDALLEVVTAPDARMQYLQAKSAVSFARSELDRQKRLLGEQLATNSQVNAAERDLKDAEATLEALKQRGIDSAHQTLRAPVDGIITRLDVSQGMRVQADTTAMLIASERRLIARLGVEPEDLTAVHAGTPVTIRSVFIPDIKVETEVREVHAMVDPGTLLVEVLAPIPEDQINGLVLGTRITGDISLGTEPGLVVPRTAILGVEPNFYLFTVQDHKAKRVAVETGVEDGDLIEISGPLKAGDEVVISGNYELTDGMAVREAKP